MNFIEATRSELERERVDLAEKLGRTVAEIEGIKAEMAGRLSEWEREAQTLRTAIGQIDNEIRRREVNDALVPTVSDHALLRYIERVCGVDIEALKAELLTETVILAIKSGATAVKTPHGDMVIKGNTVVTFKDRDMGRPKKRVPRDYREDDNEWEDA